MFDVLYGSSEYPLTYLWIERNAPTTVDDEATYEGAVPFKCRKVRSTAQKEQRIQGLKETTYLTTIKTKEELPFKAKDKIKIGGKLYSIQSANQVENDAYKDARIIYEHFEDFETELILE